jgi:hypothetical protein
MTRSKAIKIILKEIQRMGGNTIVFHIYDIEKINLERAKRILKHKPGDFIGVFDPNEYIRKPITLDELLIFAQDDVIDLWEPVTNFPNATLIPRYQDIIRKMGLGLFNYSSIDNYPEIFEDSKVECDKFHEEHKKELDGRMEELLGSFKYLYNITRLQ